MFLLGFFNQHSFDKLHQQDAYFLSQLKLQAGVYDAPNSPKQLPLATFLACNPMRVVNVMCI